MSGTQKPQSYQTYLASETFGKAGSFKRRVYDTVRNNDKLYKKYLKLISWPLSIADTVPTIKTAENILDIGIGSGLIVHYMKRYLNSHANYYGIDIAKNALLPDDVNFKVADIQNENLPFEDESMDMVISTFVIEHMTDPYKLFFEAFRVLKPGGYFWVVTEHSNTLFLPDYWNFYQDPTHVRPYTKRTFKILSESSGFKVHRLGIIRIWEYALLSPLFPVISFLTKSDFSFMPFEIIGRTVYLIAQKQ